MSPLVAQEIFLTTDQPVEPTILQYREMLKSNRKFMKIIQGMDHPAAVMTTQHQVVLANDHLTQWLDMSNDMELVGAVPGDMTPCPGCPDLMASTRYVEVKGFGFFILTVEEKRAGK